MDDLIKALTILRKYGNPARPTDCEHDQLIVNVPYDQVSQEDKDALQILGFHKGDDNNFMSYKFGSC